MTLNYKKWQKLFLFCSGIFVAAAFCMKWMENDFRQGGSLFTIIGLEISYSKQKVISILSGLDEHVKTILRYHLYFDFAFMAGVYPGIASLCMMAKEKINNKKVRRFLFLLASLQLVAWGCDVYENMCLLKWIKTPAIISGFDFYHFIVGLKWIIALAGALTATGCFLFGKKIKTA